MTCRGGIRTFLDNNPMRELLARVSVSIILHAEAGLRGTAVAAAELLDE